MRALLTGLSISVSCFVLIVSNAVFNGADEQVLRSYYNLQAGHVLAAWSKIKRYDQADPERIFSSQFDTDEEEANREALNALSEFLEKNSDRVRAFYPSLVRMAAL
jgi:hypothetical protein